MNIKTFEGFFFNTKKLEASDVIIILQHITEFASDNHLSKIITKR